MSQENELATSSGVPLGEISQAPPALEVFLDRHQTKLIVLAILLALSAAAYVVYDGIKESGEKTAGALLVAAEDASDLQGVVKDHGDAAAASSAKILLAEKQWADGQQNDAIATLNGIIEEGKGHPAVPSAKASLASMLLSQGKKDEAKDMFRDITADPEARFLAPYAWIRLGDIEAAAGDNEAAAKSYGMVETEFPGSPFSQDATLRILLLKAKAPVEVAAPEKAPETAPGAEPTEGSGEVESKDLLDVLKGAGDGSAPNPLLEGSGDSQ